MQWQESPGRNQQTDHRLAEGEQRERPSHRVRHRAVVERPSLSCVCRTADGQRITHLKEPVDDASITFPASQSKIRAAKTAISMILRSPIMTVGVACEIIALFGATWNWVNRLPVATKRRTDTWQP